MAKNGVTCHGIGWELESDVQLDSVEFVVICGSISHGESLIFSS